MIRDYALLFADQCTQILEQNPFLGERKTIEGNTFIGENSDWDFGLVRSGPDLCVHMRSKPTIADACEQEDQALLHVFLEALALVHGQHAWPFSIEHRRDCRLVLDRVHLREGAVPSLHRPFSEGLAYPTPPNQWDFGSTLGQAYSFFRQRSNFSEEVSRLLYLARESGKPGVPDRIAALAICSLLESLVRLVYDDRIIPLRKTSEAEAFSEAKKKVAAHIESCRASGVDPEAYDRLLRIVTSAQAARIEDQFMAVLDHLGLLPADWWEEIVALWKETRHPLSHRMASGDDSEENVKNNMMARSRLAGAINCIVLRLIGYSGPVRLSAFEDKYGRI